MASFRLATEEALLNVQGDGNISIPLDNQATHFQVTIERVASATGTLTFSVKGHPDASYENLVDAATDTQKTILLTNGTTTFPIDKFFLSFLRVEPATVVGQYSVFVQQSYNT